MISNMLAIKSLHGFQYMDEDSIDVELKCNICTEPFVDPARIRSCDHTFCRACIEEILENSAVCPTCLKSISSNDLEPGSEMLVTRLNKILGRCEYCNQINIQRGDFSKHLNQVCVKVVVRCPASDYQCVWTGPRDQCANHVAQCTAALKGSFLNQLADVTKQVNQLQLAMKQLDSQEINLRTENAKFKPEMKCLHQRCMDLNNENQQLISRVNKIEAKNKEFHLQVDKIEMEKRHLDLQVFDLDNQKQQLRIQINDLLSKNQALESEVNDLRGKNQQLQSQVKHLRNNNIVLESNVKDLRAEKHREEQSELLSQSLYGLSKREKIDPEAASILMKS